MSFQGERHTLRLERVPRAARACELCHARKVRCDVSPSKPQCSNCRRDGRRCEPRARQQRSSNVATAASNWPNLPGDISDGTPSKRQRHQLSVQGNSRSQPARTQDARSVGPAEGTNVDQTLQRPFPMTGAKHGSNTNEGAHMERSTCIAPDSFQAEDGWGVDHTTQVSSDASSQILDLQKALELPPRAVRDALFENFWTYCYPWDPIIERSQVVGSSLEKTSPLLLQAIFLAGSRMSSASASYAAPHDFYKRAKALFYLNFEQNPSIQLTAVSLLHWWNPHGPERVSTDTSSFWCRVAVSLAQQMGLHSQKKRICDESLRRRIWWSLVARDFLISLAHGRPRAINLDDCDVPRLTIEDFPDQTHTGHTFIAHVDLAIILGRFTTNVLRRVPPKPHVRDVEDSLYRWVKALPESIRLTQRVPNDESEQVLTPYSFESRQVHVLHFVSIILLYRPRTVEGPFPVAPVIASSAIAGIFEEFFARDDVRLLGPVFTFYLLAAAIALLPCFKYPDLWSIAQEDLRVIGKAQQELKQKWPSAIGSIRSFEKMHKLAVTIQKRVDGPPGTRLTREQAIFFEDIDAGLCRVWDALSRADVIPSDLGSNTSTAKMSQQQATGGALGLNNGPSTVSAVSSTLGQPQFGQENFGVFFDDQDLQFDGAIGDWLFWDQMTVNF